MKNGFLIVDQSYKFDDIKDRDKILRYRGFDGMIWPDDESLDDSYLQIPSHDNKKSSLVIHLCNGLIKLEDYELVVTYYNLLSSIQNTYILYIDYSFLLKYRDIDMLSMDLDLVIRINHHLDICFVSSDINLIRKVILHCEQIKLHFEMYYETYKILSQKGN